jgi:hypothetical protein
MSRPATSCPSRHGRCCWPLARSCTWAVPAPASACSAPGSARAPGCWPPPPAGAAWRCPPAPSRSARPGTPAPRAGGSTSAHGTNTAARRRRDSLPGRAPRVMPSWSERKAIARRAAAYTTTPPDRASSALIRAATSTAAMAMITWECHSRPGQAQAGWRPGRGRRRRSVGSVPRSSPGPAELLDGLLNGRSPPPRTGQHLPVSSPSKVSAQPFGPNNDSFGTPRTGPDDRADSRSGGSGRAYAPPRLYPQAAAGQYVPPRARSAAT